MSNTSSRDEGRITSRIIRSVSCRDSSESSAVISRSTNSPSNGVSSTDTGSDASAGASTEKWTTRCREPAGALPECGVPAGIHSPTPPATVHNRLPTCATPEPTSFHSSSWVGWECTPQ